MARGERELVVLASRQHQLFTTAQARACGLAATTVQRRVEQGIWSRVLTGVMRIGVGVLTHEQRLLAPCLFGPAVVSHRSGAAMWGMTGGDREVIEATAWRWRRTHAPWVTWHESYLLDEQRDVRELDGIPVTTPTRTAADLAAFLSYDELRVCIVGAVRRGQTSLEGLGRLLERPGHRRRPGSGRLDRAVQELGARGLTESEAEEELFALLERSGIRPPVPQYQLRDEFGTTVARFDGAYPELRLGVEVQSLEFHGDHDSIRRDAYRFSSVASLDWRVLPVVAKDITAAPRRVVAQFQRALPPEYVRI